MKKKLSILVIMMLAVLMAVPVSAKTIKASNTKAVKAQAKKIVAYYDGVVEAKLEGMKKGQTKTLDFHKQSARNFAVTYMTDDELPSNAATRSRWFMGSNAKALDPKYDVTDGTDHVSLYPTSYKRSGNYYTVKCTAKMYVDGNKPAYKKVGTVTFKIKVRPSTHYGLIVKEMKVTRTAKKLR